MRRIRSVSELVAATPRTRDRYVDFLRAASILVVMLGHWFMAVAERRSGTWHVSNLISELDGLWIATWLLQVMPVFFFVGGFSNLVTLDSMARTGAGYAAFVSGRTWRLMKPVLILLAIWLPLVSAAQVTEVVDIADLRLVSTAVSQPLWFIGIYLIVTGLAPPMRRLHRRFGVAIPVGLAVGAIAVDVARFALGVPLVGYLNFGFVWLFAHQLGFFYADGRLIGVGRGWLAAAAVSGLVALWGLTHFGPYPRSMVGLPGDLVSNMNPPTACLIALATWQASLLMLVRGRAARWLERPRPWGTVIALNSVIMTMFLWHLTSLVAVVATASALGIPQYGAGSVAWWLTRIPWMAVLAVVTSVFVALFGRFERPGVAAPRQASVPVDWSAAVGVTLVITGVCGFAVSGLTDFVAPEGRVLAGLPVSPLINCVAVAAGGILFRISRTGVPDRR